MNWIESEGGPLVLIEETLLDRWSGVRGGDYERACEVTDEVGAVSVGGRDALILGDEPHRTSWLAGSSGGTLVRWVYADCERSIVAALSSAQEALLEDTGVRVRFEGTCHLIDAASAGDAVGLPSIKVPIEPGTYRIETGLLDVGLEVRLLLHKLVKSE